MAYLVQGTARTSGTRRNDVALTVDLACFKLNSSLKSYLLPSEVSRRRSGIAIGVPSLLYSR